MVSGGGDGLGRAMAIGLADAGSQRGSFSRKLEKCEEAAREIEMRGVRVLGLQCDISREEDVARLMGRVLETFGQIDILVNNAGGTWGAWPEDMTFEDWHKVIDLNINGTFCPSQLGCRQRNDQSPKGKDNQYILLCRFKGHRPGVHERHSIQHIQGRNRDLHYGPGREMGQAPD